MRIRILFGIAVGLLIASPTLAQNSVLPGSYLQSQYTSGASAGQDGEPSRIHSIAAISAQAGSMPTRGMTMKQVENSFGPPAGRRSPVGDPPITRWEYQGFIVYFEYRHVIHAVVKR